MPDTFNPSRLTFARKSRGITMRSLAADLALSARTVTAYESGAWKPESDVVTRMARALRYPVEFFAGDEITIPVEAAVSFRARTSMTARERDMALTAAGKAALLIDWLNARFELPAANVPDLQGIVPETAAAMVRAEWGMGEAPIRNMTSLLELNGVRVCSLPAPTRKLDAFAYWRGDEPVVFLNTGTSSERSRMDAAHELGHLVMHREGRRNNVQGEIEANRFAASFLMPESSVLALGAGIATIASLMQRKKQWGVSLVALAYRMHSLQLITDWNYHTLCVQASQLGYRRSEPDPMPRESSQVFRKAFDMLRDDHIGLREIAGELLVSASDIADILFQLVPMAVDGAPSRQGAVSTRPRAELRLVPDTE